MPMSGILMTIPYNCLATSMTDASSGNAKFPARKQSVKSATLELYQDFIGPARESNNKQTIATPFLLSSAVLVNGSKRSS